MLDAQKKETDWDPRLRAFLIGKMLRLTDGVICSDPDRDFWDACFEGIEKCKNDIEGINKLVQAAGGFKLFREELDYYMKNSKIKSDFVNLFENKVKVIVEDTVVNWFLWKIQAELPSFAEYSKDE